MKWMTPAQWGLFILLILAVTAGWWFNPVKSYVAPRFFGDQTRPDNEVVVWHPWGGTQKELLETVMRRFEKAHPGIKVRLVFTANSLSNSQKFFTAVAANKAPDVIFVDGPQVSEWAVQGALQSLNKYVEKSGIKPDDFFTPCWKQCYYKGNVWAMTYCADPNFAFVWNREVFRKNGLDPDKPPRTIAEIDAIADKLTKSDVQGRLISIGIIPWGVYGSANSIFTWGWAFGGDFYDEKTGKITANHPKVVKALEWMCSYAKKYGITRISSLQSGFGNLDKNPFYTGELGMHAFHISLVGDARTYAPNLDYGLGYIPYPPGGEPKSSWVGGWTAALPRGSGHPDLGWELIRWCCADPVGTAVVGSTQNLLPGYRHSKYFDTIKNDPKYGVFLEVLRNCKHQRPVMPAQAYYMGALERAVDAALYGNKTPKQALDDATAETQRELDFKLKGQ